MLRGFSSDAFCSRWRVTSLFSLSLSLSISSVSLNILDPFQKMISCLLLTHWSLTYQLFNLSLTNDLQLISCLLLIICYFWSHVFIRWCWPAMFILSIVFIHNYTRVSEPWFGLPCTSCFYPQLYKTSFPLLLADSSANCCCCRHFAWLY